MKLNLFILVLLLSFGPAYSQGLLKKAKEKVNAGNKILRDIKGNGATENDNDTNGQEQTGSDDSYSERSGRPSNSKGKKLSTNSVDVAQEISNAESNLGKKDYAQTRNSIQQAILGIEVAMAYKILESLPSEIDELKAESKNDHVAASGAGYSGLTINREYNAPYNENANSGDESEGDRFMEFSLINSPLFVSGVTGYISNPVYSSDDDGDKKVLQYKGINSLLEYDEYSGYKLSVPLGQNTVIQFSCINFEDENQVIKAADMFDLEKIKASLGEK